MRLRAASTWRPARRACRTRRCPSARTCVPWPSTCWSSSTSRSQRCRELICDAAGAQVSAGFIHSCLRKAAELAADVVKLIGTLITAAAGRRVR